MGDQADNEAVAPASPAVIIRHALTDRLFHWSMAACVLILLATAFLPIIGIKFKWVTIHWVTGLILTVVVLFHILRSILWQDFFSVWFGRTDILEMTSHWKKLFNPKYRTVIKPGKYSPAQKLMHHAMSLLVLITIATGLLMMVKVDTPLWERNPYWLSDDTWGIIYIFHGISALGLITMFILP